MVAQNQELIHRLKTQMRKKGMNAKQLAEYAQVGRSFIYDILNGKSANPTTRNLVAVAKALDISVPYLLSNDNIEHPFDDDVLKVPAISAEECGFSASHIIPPSPKHTYVSKAWMSEQLGAGTEGLQLRTTPVISDNMAPTLIPGDTLLIGTAYSCPTFAGIFLISDGKSATIRRLECLPSSSPFAFQATNDNPLYAPQCYKADDIRIIGRALWVSRLVAPVPLASMTS
ncbi:MAG: DNA-binding protein [Rickettsiales bacterium]|jgi:transcriptional regulator with XRE-family HTH domain|nr:DNA-binding protein [Rickettsiales bacterium]